MGLALDVENVLEPLTHEMPGSKLYHVFKIKNGKKTREILEPYPGLKEWQKKVVKALAVLPSKDSCHSRSGRSTVTNAQVHTGASIIYKTDIKDFYNRVTHYRVWQGIRHILLSQDPNADDATMAGALAIASTISDMCFYNHKLPTGAPTSPILSNLSMWTCDSLLEKLAKDRGYTYTRYFDDITFSHKDCVIEEDLGNQIADCLSYSNFSVNQEKSKWILPNTHEAYEITGISIQNGKPQPPRNIKRLVRSMLDKKASGELESDTILNGYLAYISMIDEKLKDKLDTYYQERCSHYANQHT